MCLFVYLSVVGSRGGVFGHCAKSDAVRDCLLLIRLLISGNHARASLELVSFVV